MAVDIIDTHQHLIYSDRLAYRWTDGIDALRGRAFTYDDYLAASAGTGIAQTLFMEADAGDWQAETAMVLAMAADPATLIAGVIANARPEDPDGFDAWLDQVADTDVVGLRRILHQTTDELSETAVFRRNLRKLADRRLSFDICVLARQLPIAADLVARVENVQFILDHCGVPDIAAGELRSWRAGIEAVARLPNLACKISGISAYCAPGTASVDTLRPYVEHCIACFGWERVVWGSDWPVCNINSSIGEWVAVTRAIVKDEDPANQNKLFCDNARRLYRPGSRG